VYAIVYIRPPKTLNAPEGSVLLLRKLLYSLKQSDREWYLEACRGLETLSFRLCFSDPSVFTTEDRSLLIGLYVDDILIFRKKKETIEATVQGIKAL
jgi:hypothetical protein